MGSALLVLLGACGVAGASGPSNVTGVELVGSWPGRFTADLRSIQVRDDYAYLANGPQGLEVVGLAGLETVGVPSSDVITLGVQVDGGFAYVAGGVSGLQVIDVSNPMNPVWAAEYDTSAVASDVFVRGGHPYLASGGLEVMDVTDPSDPRRLGGRGTTYGGLDLYVTGGQFVIWWDAKSGKTYQVMAGDVVGGWTNAPSGANPEEQSAQTAAEDGTLEYRDPAPPGASRFFRVDLSP